MNNILNNNKFISLLIALFAFFILVFFTTNIYSNMQANLEQKRINTEKGEKLDNKLIILNKLKLNLENKNSKQAKIINKFIKDFSEDKIIEYINDYIEVSNDSSVIMRLDSISFSREKKSELGFKEINIDLKMQVQDISILENLLNYLTSSNSKYSFFITELNFPIEKSGPYKINIPLKMYVR